MKQWEYQVWGLPMPAEYTPSEQGLWQVELEAELNQRGENGWKLIAIIGKHGVFIRPKPKETQGYS